MTSKIYVDELYPKTTGGAVKMPTRPIFHVTKKVFLRLLISKNFKITCCYYYNKNS